MNANKVLVAGLAAIMASGTAFSCGNGGFYAGVNAGVKLNKVETKVKSTSKKVSVSKGKPLAEVLVGYDHRFNNVMLGADLILGMMFGKIDKKMEVAVGGVTYSGTMSTKNPWSVAFMPRVGWLALPQLEVFVTPGLKMARWTFSNGGKKKGKTAVTGVVGGGLRYEVTPHIYTQLQYSYDFKRKCDIKNDYITAPKVQAHVIKIGAGYRF